MLINSYESSLVNLIKEYNAKLTSPITWPRKKYFLIKKKLQILIDSGSFSEGAYIDILSALNRNEFNNYHSGFSKTIEDQSPGIDEDTSSSMVDAIEEFEEYLRKGSRNRYSKELAEIYLRLLRIRPDVIQTLYLILSIIIYRSV